MRRLGRRGTLIVIIVAALLAAGAAVAAVALVSGGGGHEAQPTIVGGNPALGRSFASLTHETNVSCLDTQTKDVATGDPVFVCSGTRDGKEMPCRPIAWNGREAHYIDFWSNAFDNGNGAVTC